MSLHVSANNNKEFEKIPNGLYIARCFQIIDMGTQTSSPQFGAKLQKKVNFVWEILDDPKMEDGRPFAVSKMYTASLFETANLRLDLEKWRNKNFTEQELDDFDLKNVLGAYCQVQIAENEKGYPEVKSVVMAKFPKDEKGNTIGKPAPVNKDVFFDIDNPNMEAFNSFNNYIKGLIVSAPEWKGQDIQSPNPSENTRGDVVIEDLPDKQMTVDDIPDEDQINIDDIPFNQEPSNSLNC